MVLAKPRGGVTVLFQDFADRGAVLADDGVITGEAGGHLADDAVADRVMIAASDQRRPRRRAERGGVELRVAQPRLGDAVHGWRRYDAAKCARDAVALIVGHDEQHVRRALWRHHPRRPIGLGICGAFLDHTAKLRVAAGVVSRQW